MPNSKPLSRRDFIKLSGITSLSLALSACGLSQTPTAMPTLTKTPSPTLTRTPTVTVTPSPSPTETPRPYETPTFNTPIFSDTLASKPDTRSHWRQGNPNYWSDRREEGGIISFDEIRTIIGDKPNAFDALGNPIRGMIIKIGGNPKLHPDWGDGGTIWWVHNSLQWSLRDGETTGAPAAVQVDIIRSPGVDGGFLSVHRSVLGTADRTSSAGFEIWKNGTPQFTARNSDNIDMTILLNKQLMNNEPFATNTFRIEFLPNGTIIPFINGINAYKPSDRPLAFVIDENHPAGFVDTHAGWINGLPNTDGKNPGNPWTGGFVINTNFRVEAPLA